MFALDKDPAYLTEILQAQVPKNNDMHRLNERRRPVTFLELGNVTVVVSLHLLVEDSTMRPRHS